MAPSAGAPGAAGGVAVPPDGPCTTQAGVTTILNDFAYALAFDDTQVYAATLSGLIAFPLGGGTGTTLTPATEVNALALAQGAAYFISSHDVGPPNPQGKVSSTTALYRMALPQGTPAIVIDGAWGTLAATDGNWVWWGGLGLHGLRITDNTMVTFPDRLQPLVTAIAVGSDALYFGMEMETGLFRAVKDESQQPTLLLGLVQPPDTLTGDDSRLYWSDGAGVHSATYQGTDQKILFSNPVTSVAVDAHAVYFTTVDDNPNNPIHSLGSVLKLPKTGGGPSTIASGLDSPGKIALHGGNVYWVDGTSVAGSDPNPGYAVKTACK
jgi:hypothetical protein